MVATGWWPLTENILFIQVCLDDNPASGETRLSYIAPFVFLGDFELIHHVALKTFCNNSIPWDFWVKFVLPFFLTHVNALCFHWLSVTCTLLKQYVLIDIRGQAFPEVSAVYYRLDQFVSGFP